MKRKRILIIAENQDALASAMTAINQVNDWEIIGSYSEQDAMTQFENNEIDIVVLISGITEESEQQLREQFRMQKPSISIIQNYGNSNIKNDITAALDQSQPG